MNFSTFLKSAGRHHVVIFTVTILLIIAGTIFSLYQIVDQVLSQPIQPSSTIPSFDQETIEKIQKLHDSNAKTGEIILPSPRQNPFIE